MIARYLGSGGSIDIMVSLYMFFKFFFLNFANVPEKLLTEAIKAIDGLMDSRPVNNRISSLKLGGIRLNQDSGSTYRAYEFLQDITTRSDASIR